MMRGKRFFNKQKLYIFMVFMLLLMCGCTQKDSYPEDAEIGVPIDAARDINAKVYRGQTGGLGYSIEYPEIQGAEKTIEAWARELVASYSGALSTVVQESEIKLADITVSFRLEEVGGLICVRQMGFLNALEGGATASTQLWPGNETIGVLKLFFVDPESGNVVSLPDVLASMSVIGTRDDLYTLLRQQAQTGQHRYNDLSLLNTAVVKGNSVFVSVIGAQEEWREITREDVEYLLNTDASVYACICTMEGYPLECPGDCTCDKAAGVYESIFSPCPVCRPAESLNIPKTPKKIALTFDDGPSEVTTQILDILEEHGVVATFFLIGRQVPEYKDVIVRMDEMGMEIGNHTWDHKNLAKIKKWEIINQFTLTQDIIREVTGKDAFLIRMPYGSANKLVYSVAESLNLCSINWSIDPWDWDSKDSALVFKDVKEHVHDGGVLLLHDIYPSTAEAVKYLIPYLLQEGYEFVTVSELFEGEGIELKAGQEYRSVRPEN